MPTTDPPPSGLATGKLVIEYASFREFVERSVGCLSRDGIYVETERPRPVGSRVGLELQVSDGFRLLKGLGEVVWVRAAEGDPAASGMGIRFQGLDGASRRLLDKVVESYEREGRPTFSLTPPPAAEGPTAAAPAAPMPPPAEPEAPPASPPTPPPPEPDPAAAAPEPEPEPGPGGPPDGEGATADRPPVGEQLPLTPPPAAAPAEEQPAPGWLVEAPIAEEPIAEEPIAEEPIGEGPIDERLFDEAPVEEGRLDAGRLDAECLDAEPLDAEPGAAERGDEVAAPFRAGPPPPPEPAYPPEPEGAVERLFEQAARRDLPPAPPSAPAERLGLETLPEPVSPAEMLGAEPAGGLPGPAAPAPAAASAVAGSTGRTRRPGRGRWLALGALVLALAAGGVWWSGAWRALVPGAPEPGIAAQGPAAVAPDAAPRGKRRGARPAAEGEATPVTDDSAADAPTGAEAPAAAVAPDPAGDAPAAGSPTPEGGAPATAVPETAPAPEPAPPPPPAQPAAAPPVGSPPAAPGARFGELRRITWQEGEGTTVLVLEADGVIPGGAFEVAGIGGERPRQLIKLFGVRRGYSPSTLEVGGPLLTRVRTGLHEEPEGRVLHVVADLADGGVRLLRAEARDGELRVVFGR